MILDFTKRQKIPQPHGTTEYLDGVLLSTNWREFGFVSCWTQLIEAILSLMEGVGWLSQGGDVNVMSVNEVELAGLSLERGGVCARREGSRVMFKLLRTDIHAMSLLLGSFDE